MNQEAQPLDDVFKATAPNGETCHFGTYRGAEIWAGSGGKVERIVLRNFSLASAVAVAQDRLCQDEPGHDFEPLPARDASKPAEEQGLFRKFQVRRTDGSSAPGCRHADCEYFVIDVHHDAHAGAALAAYADAVESTHPALAADMRERYALERAGTLPCHAAEGRTFYADPAQLKMTQAAAMMVRRQPDAQHTVPVVVGAVEGTQV